ncbi:hypothetical protein SAMN06295905_0640 [Devosia lucknowensis]|uniref:PIN domain-containing protein n=1 Tax=Devosia lucknowensis TaxID=1096929 RepID=A0A1Y6EI18_9HYPH|nr:PIN domain-containing protein [Devosia lucknowensis]SMQ62254.1 hypothetical protein SAMN06295905_0640 [Devosia lucknowensis]
MITLDTSVWIDHLNNVNEQVSEYPDASEVLIPHVIGEIALGTIRDRRRVLDSLNGLSQLIVANTEEVMTTIERHGLAGSGIGFVDANLIASCLLTQDCLLWTRDRRLAAVADRLGLGVRMH